MKLQFYPIEFSYDVEGGKPVIHLYGRTVSGAEVKLTCRNFLPYFWVLNANEEELKKIAIQEKEKTVSLVKSEVEEKEFQGRTVRAIKVYAAEPKDILLLREEIKKYATVLEADIPYTVRFLIDNNVMPLMLYEAEGDFVQATFDAERITQAEGVLQPKVLAFDIETLGGEESPIVMVAFCGKNYRKVITWKRFKTGLDYVEFVNSEAELISRFQEVVNELKPDILVGYFSDGFDLPCVKARAEKYKVKLELGPAKSDIRIRKGFTNEATINGLAHLDLCQFIRRIVGRVLETSTYSLEEVSRELLKEEKHDVDFEMLPAKWENGEIEEYCKYNLRDAELTFMLTEKLMPNIIEIVKIVGLPITAVTRMSYSQLVEWYLIRKAKEHNQLVPSRPTSEEISRRAMQTYTGAFVYEPKPGLYNDVVIFDFRSLYPTIISAHNISPDTLNCRCCIAEAELVEGKNWFCKKRKGFVSKVIEELIERRMRIKEIMKTKKDKMLEARSETLKTIANAMYGYLGFFGARWYSIECARSITAYERYYITQVIEKAKQEKFNVLYSDTDSILLTLDEKKQEDVERFIDRINQGLPGMMALEFQGNYKAGIFVATKTTKAGAKKKYALLSKEGSVRIKGFETIRRNTAVIAKEVQEEVLRMVLEGRREEAVNYVKEIIRRLRRKELPLEKVIITTQLQKETHHYEAIGPHVAAAKRMQEKGKKVAPGMMISYIVTAGKERIRERVKLPEEVSKDDYDAEYYINHQLIPAIKQIFEVLGYDAEELLQEKEQSKLGKFITE